MTPRVIVVGSSAGGLDALTKMLSAVDPDLDWCFVVAQHLSPSDPSMLADLLDRATPLHVVEASDGDRFAAGTVFVSPPGFDIVLRDGGVHVDAPSGERRPWPSIDHLLQSAAETLGGRAVAVVLSGTGDDGAAGAEAVEAAGGVVAVQDPDTSQFGAMPRAAFATGSVDVVAAAGDIPAALVRLLDADWADPKATDQPDDSVVSDAIGILLNATGMDFSGYKSSTVRRQIARRQRATNSRRSADYVALLERDEGEASSLSHILLVTVTAFFRDATVWDGVPTHLKSLAGEGPLRLWVPGCASGEEAYTLAMLAADALSLTSADLGERVKIFATDLDERTLDVGRRGRYSSARVGAVPERLRSEWMHRVGSDWEVIPALRECVVFARHNVAFDPPFPRIHLVSLRNTLIYFQPQLQQRVLQLCRFALVPNGLLLLGQSERVPRDDSMFTVVDHERRLYRRTGLSPSVGLFATHSVPPTRTPPNVADSNDGPHATSAQTYRTLLRALAPPALMVDESGGLVEVIGDVSPWCAVAEGPHTGNVVDLLRDPYRMSVRAMLSQLRFSTTDSVVRELADTSGGVVVRAQRLGSTGTAISFDVTSGLPSGSAPADAGDDPEILRVTAELESTREALQSTVEDLTTSNEELQATNEELQASSEELEGTNAALTTLNHEVQARSTELDRANTDLENVLLSLTNGLVLVDRDLEVTRYTPLAIRLFSLIPEDIGRPLSAVPTTIPVPQLTESLLATVGKGESRIVELTGSSRDVLLQTQPFIGPGDDIVGAIVVIIDVTEIAVERRERERALKNLEVVTESVRELVWQRDASGTLTLLTSKVEDLYGLARDRVLADPSLLSTAVHPDDRERIAILHASAQSRRHAEYRIVRPDGSVRWVDESTVTVDIGRGKPDITIGSAIDVTDRHRLQVEANGKSAVLNGLLSAQGIGILVLDTDDRVLQLSGSLAAVLGYPAESLVGTPLSMLFEPEELVTSDRVPLVHLEARRVTDATGASRPVTIEFLSVAAQDEHLGEPSTRVAVVHDVSRMREISTELAVHEQFDQQTGLLTRAYFRARTAASIASADSTGIAVLWIDLDGFKEVNDRFGHRSGDIVLAAIARRLQASARRDDVIGRLGGDEFAVLVSRLEDVDGIDVLAHRILASVRQPVRLESTLAYVSASIGISVFPQDGATAESLLHNADTAMYVAKKRGRDRHAYFTPEMDNAADERAAVRHELAAAIRNKEFELHYQPVFDVASGEVALIEALVRWRRGGVLVSAGEFIDTVTETGQLRALGRIVLSCLDTDMATMLTSLGDRQPRVAVNLSGIELEERDIIEWLLAWSPPGGFEKVLIEVTESVLLTEGGRARENLSVLRRLGATISVDDFGTGYSNLELLDRLAPGIIKIDRSLLERAVEDARGSKILDAAVQLANALDAEVVTEGVSSGLLYDHVKDLDVTLAQGFHLARPMPLDDLISFLGQ